MVILLIIMALTLGLACRARVGRHGWRPVDAVGDDEVEIMDACARASVLVLAALAGLFALGVTYGNVLGANAVR